jgi:hypothetical protein
VKVGKYIFTLYPSLKIQGEFIKYLINVKYQPTTGKKCMYFLSEFHGTGTHNKFWGWGPPTDITVPLF